MMRRHAELLCEHMGEERGCKELRKHVAWYLKGFTAGGELRNSLALVSSLAALDDLLSRLDPTEPFPVAALGTPRGRQGSPRRVVLPQGWLDDTDGTDCAVAGGPALRRLRLATSSPAAGRAGCWHAPLRDRLRRQRDPVRHVAAGGQVRRGRSVGDGRAAVVRLRAARRLRADRGGGEPAVRRRCPDLLVSLLSQAQLNRSVDEAARHVMDGFASLEVHADVASGVSRLARGGFRLVTLTNGAAAVAERLLTSAGLRDRFERLLSVEDAEAWKPAAAPYRYAASECGVEPAADGAGRGAPVGRRRREPRGPAVGVGEPLGGAVPLDLHAARPTRVASIDEIADLWA